MNKISRFLLTGFFLMALTDTLYASGRYYQMMDDSGRIVYGTGWNIRLGDEFLTQDNKRYEIIGIDGQMAQVKLIGQINLVDYAPRRAAVRFSALGTIAHAAQPPKVAVYHTHNDEAYEPSDGVESSDEGNGGIIKVGNAFSQALESEGIQTIHSDTNHNPHDNMAYERSRRTVVSLLKQKPDAIFDLHRDAAPREAYQGNIGGADVTKVQLVVGKYGPTGKQVEEYAMQMKAASDAKHPGLVKGIFFAKGGDYNQDLHPKSMLVEVGAQTNSREDAERGIAMFADAVPTVLGITSANQSNINGASGMGTTASGPSGSVQSIGWIAVFVIAGIALFMFLSTGSMKEAKAKLKNFTHQEFTNFLGFAARKKNKDDDERKE